MRNNCRKHARAVVYPISKRNYRRRYNVRFFKKKKVKHDIISDEGLVKKTDIFSVVVITASNILSVILIILGILIFIHS